MILDFSQPNFNYKKLHPQNDFEQSIIDFLDQWFNDALTMQVQTSGSTGTPKKFYLSKENMVKSAQMTGRYLNLNAADSAILVLPVSYIAGKMMLVRAIVLGLKLYCIEPRSTIHFEDLKQLDSNLENIDFVAVTPMQVENSLDFIARCKKVIVGGAPLSEKVKQALLPLQNDIYETYAMTETITHIAFKIIENQKNKKISGLFEVFDEIEINVDDRQCLTIKTPYQEEILVTNDVVKLVDKKNFEWLGRADNVINSGGIKLFPEQIENKLKPFIDQAFYISYRKDEQLGQKLVLVIEGENTDFDWSKAELDPYENPKDIIFESKFERTESGKIKRKNF